MVDHTVRYYTNCISAGAGAGASASEGDGHGDGDGDNDSDDDNDSDIYRPTDRPTNEIVYIRKQ